MRFSLEIELGNAEMQSFQDLRDALKQVATKLGSRQHCLGGAPSDGDGSKIMDGNGNTVGKWELTDTPADPIERMYAEAFEDDGEDEKKFITVDSVTVEDICEQCGKNIRQCTCDSELCECGRIKKDCIAFDNGDSFQHGDR